MAFEISSCDMFEFMVDETTDSSGVEQISVWLRTVSDELVADEQVLGLFCLERCDAGTIFTAIIDVLKRFGIESTKCRAMCFDGMSTFQGMRSGVGSRFQEIEKRQF